MLSIDFKPVAAFIFLLLFYLLFLPKISAQEKSTIKISFLVSDSVSHASLEGVSVFVYDRTQNKIVSSLLTDSSGICVLLSVRPPSDTTISLQFYIVGYKKQTIDLNKYAGPLQLIPIFLAPETKILKEVKVFSKQTPVTFSGSNLEFDITKVPNYEHMLTLDIMNYLPFLMVDEADIKMMGLPLVILINNKHHPFYSSPKNLNSLPPQAIEKIEVSIIPSARSGASKVMNITLKKNYFLGWNGNFNFNGSPFGVNPSGSLNYWGNKYGISISANFGYYKSKTEGNISMQSSVSKTSVNQSLHSNTSGPNGSAFASVFYNIDSLSTLDLQWVYSPRKTSVTKNLFVDYKDSSNSTIQQYSEYTGQNKSSPQIIGLNYTHKFKKQGKELLLLSQFSNGSAKNTAELKNSSINRSTLLYDQIYFGNSENKEATIEVLLHNNRSKNIDYTLGTKLIKRWYTNNDNQNTFYYNPDSMALTDGYYKYFQTISSTYSDADIKLQNKLTLHTGLRFEYVSSSYKQPFQIQQNYFNIIPTISLTYNPNRSNTFSASYFHNVLRPGFVSLIPFNISQNAYSQDSGNTNLQPQYSNSYGIQYYSRIKNINWGAEINYNYIDNFIDAFYTTLPTGGIVNTYSNSRYNSLSISFNIEMPLIKKIRFSHFSSVSTVRQKGLGYNNEQLSGYIQDKFFYAINNKQRLFLAFSAFSPNTTLQGKSQSMAYLKTMLSYSYFFSLFHQNPAQLGLSLSNPWLTKGLPSYNEQQSPAFYYYSKTYHSNPIVGLQFVINFKGKQFRNNSLNRSKSIQNNDVKQNEN